MIATALSQTTIRIVWNVSTDTGGSGLAGYRVFRSLTSVGGYAQVGSDLSPASLSFDDTSLSAGQQRFYRVAAFDGRGNTSAQSSVTFAQTLGGGTTLPGFTPVSGYALLDNGDGTYQITGTGFGTKANAKPLWWFPLETDFNAHATLSRNTGNLSPDSTAVIQTSVRPVNATAAARVRACTSARQIPPPMIFQSPFTFTSQHLYVFIKRRYADAGRTEGGTGVALESKGLRLWNGAAGNPPDTYVGLGEEGGSSQTEGVDYPMVTINGSAASHYHNIGYDTDTWITFEHIFQESSSTSTNDGIWNTWYDGKFYHDYRTRWKTVRGTKVGFFDEYSNSNGDSFDYFHSIYIDDSPKRVWISDKSSFVVANHVADSGAITDRREVWIPMTWADGSIRVSPRLGSFTSYSGKSLFVGTDLLTAVRIGTFV